jgi:hypothetical protein
VLVAPYFGCLFVGHPFFWMARWWTLETTAALLIASSRLQMMWIMLFHHWKGCPALKQRESISFWWFLAHQDDFAIKNATNIIFKAKKAQSYYSLHALSNGAKRCTFLHWNRQENATAMALFIVIVTMEKQNHFGAWPHLSVSLLAQPTTPQRANKTPYLQGTGAPRRYPHMLISHLPYI